MGARQSYGAAEAARWVGGFSRFLWETLAQQERLPLQDDSEHITALMELERLWNAQVGTQDFVRLGVLGMRLDEFERKRWPLQTLYHTNRSIKIAFEEIGL